MRRQIPAILTPLAAILLLVAATAAPAQAHGLGKPTGRLLEAIVAHEMGHCLGYWGHGNYPSIMRAGFDTYRIQTGAHPYTPTTADYTAMQKSRVDSGGRTITATTLVQYPNRGDLVTVFNRTGVNAAFTAAKRWDAQTSFDIRRAKSEPANGVTIQFDDSVNGTGALAVTVAPMVWNGSHYEIIDCTIKIGTKVVA